MIKTYASQLYSLVFGQKKNLLEEKLLLAGTLFGAFAGFFATILNGVFGYPFFAVLTPFVIGIALLVLYYFIRFKNKYASLFLPISIVAMLGIGVIWIFNGGYDGANTFGLFTVFILVLCVVPMRQAVFMLFYFLAVLIALYAFQFNFPEYIVPYPTEEVRFIDSLITTSVTTVLIFLMITFLIGNYRQERKISNDRALKLLELNEELKRSNQSKDKLLSVMAHDLRSPFTGILGFSELLKYNLANKKLESSEEIIDYIELSAKNTLTLLDNLLEWARIQSGKRIFNPKLGEIGEILHEALGISEPMAAYKNIAIEYIQQEKMVGRFDAHILQTIVRNLLSNAIKFSFPNSKIIVLVELVESNVQISISDSGIGMDDETVKLLFSGNKIVSCPGTADEKGSGVGLLLCKELIEMHNGTIWAESELDKGSTFIVSLPFKNE